MAVESNPIVVQKRSEPAQSPVTSKGWGIVATCLALILVAASLLRFYEAAYNPRFLQSWENWLKLAGIQAELVFGLWLLSGIRRFLAWRAVFVCFALFGAFSLYQALIGEKSCKCFGRLHVHPWYSLSLDLAMLGAILYFPPEAAMRGKARKDKEP